MSNPILRIGDKDGAVVTLRALLQSQGYNTGGNSFIFDRPVLLALVQFQSGHQDAEGKPLVADGVVGPRTWWALENPSGAAQRANHKIIESSTQAPDGLRGRIVAEALRWYFMPTEEKPDGANWGGNVSKILAHAGGARPWCCHFVSHVWLQVNGSYLWGTDWGLVHALWREAEKRGCAHKRGSGYRPKPGDFAVQLHRDNSGALTGTGHIWFAVAVDRPGSDLYNSVGGNEGNRVKLNTRETDSSELWGWINPYGDDKEPLDPAFIGLIAKGATAAPVTYAGTR